MKFKHRPNGEHSVSVSAKRLLSIITLRTLMVSSSADGESNEYVIVLDKEHYKASLPSLTQKRLQELLVELQMATFSELKLGYVDQPILVGSVSSNGKESADLTVSAAYMDCVLKLGCLPA